MTDTNYQELQKSIQRLEDLEAIKSTKHAYFRCMTLGLREELRELMTEDVKTSYSDGAYVFDNREKLLKFLIDSNSQATSTIAYWMAAMPEINLTSESTATGIWGMYHHYLRTDQRFVNEIFVYYSDEYRKENGRWKIAKTGYQSVYDKITKRDDVPFQVQKPAWADAATD
jgi:hypothetical protein